jgi:hypothetical protein
MCSHSAAFVSAGFTPGQQSILTPIENNEDRWLLTLAGLVTIFAAFSFAQQNDATDPQLAQQIRALTLQYEEALNEHDAKAAAAFFTEDAVRTTPQGTFYGRSAIERRLEAGPGSLGGF